MRRCTLQPAPCSGPAAGWIGEEILNLEKGSAGCGGAAAGVERREIAGKPWLSNLGRRDPLVPFLGAANCQRGCSFATWHSGIILLSSIWSGALVF